MNELAAMSGRARWRLDAKYFAEIWRRDSLQFLAEILRGWGAKKSCAAEREGLARGVRSLLRWCGLMGG